MDASQLYPYFWAWFAWCGVVLLASKYGPRRFRNIFLPISYAISAIFFVLLCYLAIGLSSQFWFVIFVALASLIYSLVYQTNCESCRHVTFRRPLAKRPTECARCGADLT